jgi:hypothetical protein
VMLRPCWGAWAGTAVPDPVRPPRGKGFGSRAGTGGPTLIALRIVGDLFLDHFFSAFIPAGSCGGGSWLAPRASRGSPDFPAMPFLSLHREQTGQSADRRQTAITAADRWQTGQTGKPPFETVVTGAGCPSTNGDNGGRPSPTAETVSGATRLAHRVSINRPQTAVTDGDRDQTGLTAGHRQTAITGTDRHQTVNVGPPCCSAMM